MKDDRIVVLGLGRSGRAAARLLLAEGARVTVLESGSGASVVDAAADLRAAGAEVVLGREAEEDPRSYDLCVISPGIDPSVPLVRNVAAKGVPIVAEIELAFRRCPCRVAAITGTNGKTTTTGLAVAMLEAAGVRCVAAGNIGRPFSEVVAESSRLDAVVLEVSSFQLEAIDTFRPAVAAWLNFSPNHLDRYATLDDYRAAKLRIFRNQEPGDTAVVNAASELPPLAARRLSFSARLADADYTLRDGWICRGGEPLVEQAATRLPGPHNAENLMAALAVGEALGAPLAALAAAAPAYRPPAHRCEFIRELDGVRWINDSKATSLDAMRAALGAQDAPVVLIAGGKDKGFGFAPMLPIVLERVRHAVLIGEMRERIAQDWAGVGSEPAATLEEAVAAAARAARPGDTVLFSPGTSSFDMFRDYEERGECFRAAVLALKPRSTTSNQPVHQP